jgi:hypothetical protein
MLSSSKVDGDRDVLDRLLLLGGVEGLVVRVVWQKFVQIMRLVAIGA